MFGMRRMTKDQDVRARLRTAPGRLFFIAMLALAALLVVAGCATPGATQAKPTPTLTAQQILTKAQGAHLTDETFTITVQGTSSGIAVNVTGNGKLTENPVRAAMTLTTVANDITITLDLVLDVATNSTYTRVTAPASLATDKWTKTTGTSDTIPASDLQLSSQYSKLTDATLVGSEQVNGVDTYHVKGTNTDSSSSGAVDVYLSKSNYFPVKMVLHSTGDAAVDVTITYTAVNTGITIDLPAA